ncbi:MAG: hypothetical protein H6709_10830 [Kofleriaceae bacterium]|nr:hypothetical protein [Kofleriaceae bacterium]
MTTPACWVTTSAPASSTRQRSDAPASASTTVPGAIATVLRVAAVSSPGRTPVAPRRSRARPSSPPRTTTTVTAAATAAAAVATAT